MTMWCNIDTAPKDGTYILAVVKGYVPNVCAWMEGEWFGDGEWFGGTKFFIEGHSYSYKPTHWMPLPEGP